MPVVLAPHHSRRFYIFMLAVAIFIAIVIVSFPITDDKQSQKQFPLPLVSVEPAEQPGEAASSASPEALPLGVSEASSGAAGKTSSASISHSTSSSVTIKTYWGRFDPEKINIDPGTQVTWLHADKSKKFLIACYVGPLRLLKSESIYPGESFSYTFTQEEEYLCIDAIYGARGFITVGNPPKKEQGIVGSADNLLTGGAVRIDALSSNVGGPINLRLSLDPVRRMLFTPQGFAGLVVIALIFLVVASLEHSIRLIK